MIFKFSSKGKWQHGHQKECLKAEMEPCLSTCLGCLVRRARQKHSAGRNNKNAGLWQSGAAERAAQRAAHSRVPWKRVAWSVESCGIQKWLVPTLESHNKTKSLEKTGKKWHGEVEDVTSTDCIATKDEEGVSVLHTRHGHLSGEIKSYHKMKR